jgi:hypothetical protein
MEVQLQRIKSKLTQLKSADTQLEVFGAKTHAYQLNARLSERRLRLFEKKHGIILPPEYRNFLSQIGNGGAGPYYGLLPLEKGNFADISEKKATEFIVLSTPFLHTKAWNKTWEPSDITDEKTLEYLENDYFDPKWSPGMLRIAHAGCGIAINLIVNGPEYGNIWVDSRVNDNGIYPEVPTLGTGRIQFLDWYEQWLDREMQQRSIKSTNKKQQIGNHMNKDRKNQIIGGILGVILYKVVTELLLPLFSK